MGKSTYWSVSLTSTLVQELILEEMGVIVPEQPAPPGWSFVLLYCKLRIALGQPSSRAFQFSTEPPKLPVMSVME